MIMNIRVGDDGEYILDIVVCKFVILMFLFYDFFYCYQIIENNMKIEGLRKINQGVRRVKD